MNISSVVVKCSPEHIEYVLEKLREGGDCEIYAHDELGRVIVILEGETTEEESEKLRRIQEISHILSAEMVYAFSENEFAPEEEKFERVNPEIIDRLNDEGINAKDIVYNGHVKDF